jgi:hypothetical protein
MTTTPYSAVLGDREPIATMRDSMARVQATTRAWRAADYERPWAPGKWTAREILVHLAETELALGNRARMALTTPNYAAQKFDQDSWLALDAGVAGPDAVAALAALSRLNVALFERLSAAQRAIAMAHPEYGTITVDWIVHMIAGHQLHHLAQLERTQGIG